MFGGDDWEFEANQECFANLELYSPMKDLAQNCDGIDIPRMNHTPSKSVCSKNELQESIQEADNVFNSTMSSQSGSEAWNDDEDFVDDQQPRKSSIPWLAQEDEALTQLATANDFKNWSFVAYELSKLFPNRPKRTCNQCNQRWMRVLNPSIVKGKWEPEEDERLLASIRVCPPRKWKAIANMIPGRTDIQVRYRIKKMSGWLQRRGVPKELLF